MNQSVAGSLERPTATADRSAGSFLVRVWYEAREAAGGPPTFRGYIRNLLTGEERFIRDPATVSEEILEQIRTGAVGPGEGTKR